MKKNYKDVKNPYLSTKNLIKTLPSNFISIASLGYTRKSKILFPDFGVGAWS